MSAARFVGVIPIVALAIAGLSCGRSALAPPPDTPQLWLWQNSLLRSEANLEAAERMIDRARGAGYTGIAFWDVSFSYLNSPNWPAAGAGILKSGLQYAVDRGMKVLILGTPFGYSNDVLNENPNWAEGERVAGSRFVVDSSGRALRQIDTFTGLENGDFEHERAGWFNTSDEGISIDSLERHGGDASGMIEAARDSSRFAQLVHLTPWRQYHIRLFLRSAGYRGQQPHVQVFDSGPEQRFLMNMQIAMAPTQQWTQVDATFNSRSSSQAWLYLGVWGGHSGKLWFDDVSMRETALVYVIRRTGAPLRIYDPTGGGRFEEGRDFDPVRDPGLTADPHDDYHDPPTVTLPATTRMRPGENVAIDYYAAQPIDSKRLGVCLTDPDFAAWTAANTRKVIDAAPPGAGIFLQYDEMRQMNSCDLCRSRGKTAGQLLAWHVGESLRLWRSMRPDAHFYVWNDMFDPFANAHNNYYLVDGDIAGSWRGLPPEITVMNWNLPRLDKSLKWFSGLHHRQIIAGYYDSHDGAAAAAEELAKARSIAGIDGLMYTTWENDYSQMEAFAESARRNWEGYRTTVRH